MKCKQITFHRRGRPIKVRRCEGRTLASSQRKAHPQACRAQLRRAMKGKGRRHPTSAMRSYNACRAKHGH